MEEDEFTLEEIQEIFPIDEALRYELLYGNPKKRGHPNYEAWWDYPRGLMR